MFFYFVGLGAPYGWSAISASLTREFGFVSSSAADWGLAECTYPMSIMVRVILSSSNKTVLNINRILSVSDNTRNTNVIF